MDKFLQSLGFTLDENFDDRMRQFYAAHAHRLEIKETKIEVVTSSTVLAVLIHRSQAIQQTLISLGFRDQEFLSSIGLGSLVYGNSEVAEVGIHENFERVLVNYAKSSDAILETTDEVFAIAILEDSVISKAGEPNLLSRLDKFGITIDQLSRELESRTLAFDPRAQFAPQLKSANDHYESGRYKEALADYRQINKIRPDNILGGMGIANSYLRLGDYDQALGIFNLIIHKFPNDQEAIRGKEETLKMMKPLKKTKNEKDSQTPKPKTSKAKSTSTGKSASTSSLPTTYLLTWNPELVPYSRFSKQSEEIKFEGEGNYAWSTGNRKNVSKGDRVFLMRQGVEPRGLVGAGTITQDGATELPHWDEEKRKKGDTFYKAEINWDTLVELPILTREEMVSLTGEGKNLERAEQWRKNSSGYC